MAAESVEFSLQLSNLHVYGTPDTPLFPVREIAKVICSSRIRVDQGQYEEGLDYTKVAVTGRDGKVREQNLLTELGLYNVIFRSNTDAGRRFRIFVTGLLKDLRQSQRLTQGQLLQNMVGRQGGDAGDHLYFITDGEWTKIGRSGDIACRLQQLQTGNARELTLLRTFPGMGHLEKTVHDRVSRVARRRSEWFHITDLDPIYEWLATV